MIIYPAIDIMGGRVVRLKQGRPDRATVYADDPVEMAERWRAAGAEILHVVDLDGAFAGAPRNLEAVERIVRAVDIPVQLGGGLRSLEAVDRALGSGVDRVVIGTTLVTDPDFTVAVLRAHPGRIVAGIDAKNGRVAIAGWSEETNLDGIELARSLDELGVVGVVYTDIVQDGMGTGVNIRATGALAKSIAAPVIASGGVATLEDIRRLRPLEKNGVVGVIIGTALYEGAFTLEEAIREGKAAYEADNPLP